MVSKRSRALQGGLAAFVLGLTALGSAAPALAQADPAAARVEAFDGALIASMKAGAAAGVKGRARILSPAIAEDFDLATMARFAVGAAWTGFSEAQRQAVVAAFTRFTVASYASNFDGYSGQSFKLSAVQTRGLDKIVPCVLTAPHNAPVNLIYRLHQTPAGWRIIDIYFNGVSQLTTRRADFAAPVQSGGADGLVRHLDALTAKLES
ncbi:MAG: ABC transporter substrate-binding protein [Alphaproteobacteria bacterium]|nr:ABC transporter substrate-binding protein [Alphaproteobacteria bacterium]